MIQLFVIKQYFLSSSNDLIGSIKVGKQIASGLNPILAQGFAVMSFASGTAVGGIVSNDPSAWNFTDSASVSSLFSGGAARCPV